MSDVYDIFCYEFTNKDKFFLDTNIWFYILGSPGSPYDSKSYIYSESLKKARGAQSRLMVDGFIISEFINCYARLEHKRLSASGEAPDNFKKFRNSKIFTEIAQDIGSAVRKILFHSECINLHLSITDLQSLLTEFEEELADFNDQLIVRLCKQHDLILITHDKDFLDFNIDILTANYHMLQ